MTSYQPGDYEARHVEPVWRSRANFIIAANISDRPEVRQWEQLWVRKIRERQFEICCIPFFVFNLALGDEVETDDKYVLKRVVKPSGHCTFRVWFDASPNATSRNDVPALLEKEGCELEWSSENLLAVDAATPAIAQRVADILYEREALRELQYETGRTQ